MPDMTKAQAFQLEGHCPERNTTTGITVHAVPHEGAWKAFGLTCPHIIKAHQPCTQNPCPIRVQIQNIPLPE